MDHPSNGKTKRGFYADIRRDGRGTILLAGPYRTYSEAKDALRWARVKALNSGDPRAHFDAYGCCHIDSTRLRSGIYTPADVLRTRRDRDGFVIEHMTEEQRFEYARDGYV